MNTLIFLIQGNPVIMILITLAAVIILFQIYRLRKNPVRANSNMLIVSGAVALLIGILGQTIGIIQMLNMIEQVSEVPPNLVVDGIKLTFIPLAYGGFWFLISLLANYLLPKSE